MCPVRPLAPSDQEDAIGRSQIGQKGHNPSEAVFILGIDGRFLQNVEPGFPDEFAKIQDRDDPDVGSVVPLVGKLASDRGISTQEQL